jgi:uncharacterized protein (DUF1800 family)
LFVCQKLCRRFVGDNPPDALVKAAAAVWTQNLNHPAQIAQVVRFIATNPDFAQSWGQKVKRPLEVAASYLRAAEIDFTPTEGVMNEMAAGGQRLFGWAPPTGHPDIREYWLSTNAMRHRWSLLFGLTDNYWQTGLFNPVAPMGQANPTALETATFWQARLNGEPDPATVQSVLTAMKIDPDQRFPDGPKDPKSPLRHIVAYLAMGPEFQLR